MSFVAKLLGEKVVETGLTIIDKIVPDKDLARKLKHEFESQSRDLDYSLILAQIDVNKEEAKHSSIFVAGWRPFVGWVCGIGVLWHFIIREFWIWAMFTLDPDLIQKVNDGTAMMPPKLDITDLLALLTGMLGLTAARTYEKKIGVARSNIDEPEAEKKPRWRWLRRNK